MNAPSVLRIIGGVTLVVGGFAIGNVIVKTGQKTHEKMAKVGEDIVKVDQMADAIDETNDEIAKLEKERDQLQLSIYS